MGTRGSHVPRTHALATTNKLRSHGPAFTGIYPRQHNLETFVMLQSDPALDLLALRGGREEGGGRRTPLKEERAWEQAIDGSKSNSGKATAATAAHLIRGDHGADNPEHVRGARQVEARAESGASSKVLLSELEWGGNHSLRKHRLQRKPKAAV